MYNDKLYFENRLNKLINSPKENDKIVNKIKRQLRNIEKKEFNK